MEHQFTTQWPLFVGIIVVYMIVSLVIGGKKTYFEPFEEPAADKPEETPAPTVAAE